MFASLTQKDVPIPGEKPETVTIRRLTGAEYDGAQYEHMTGIAAGRGRNWAAKFLQLAAAGKATEADAKRVLADPLAGFDRLALVKAGVVTWSCTLPDGKPREVTAKAIEDLEDEPLELLATEILKLTKPALFQTPEEAEAAQKNG